MTALNQSSLRGILAAITSVDEKFIVPKQGNWWNPQEAGAERPNNWLAYTLRHRQRTAPFYHSEDGRVNSAVAEMLSTIEMQFVGPDSEDIAQSVALWDLRTDVKERLASVRGALIAEGAEPEPSTFYQDGSNTVVAWNVSRKVLWYKTIETDQPKASMTIILGGKTNGK